MKRIAFILSSLALLLSSCDEEFGNTTFPLTVSLTLEGKPYAEEGIPVLLRDLNADIQYERFTDQEGKTIFEIPQGLYEGSVSHKMLNGINSDIRVTGSGPVSCTLSLIRSEACPVVIKELYFGQPMPDQSGKAPKESYVILYNNGDKTEDISNFGFAYSQPFNANATNKWYRNGSLAYRDEGWIPAGTAVWWFNGKVSIPPYSQISISIFGAIDNTRTFPNACDMSEVDYVMYQPEIFSHALSYPAPSAKIPTSHYLKTFLYGRGTGWALSQTSPAFFILDMEGLQSFVKDESNYDRTDFTPVVKVPVRNIVDAIEVFDADKLDKSIKRLTPGIDNGFLRFTGKLGYSAYRNVDKEATEQLEGNKGKLVYGYSLGTEKNEGTTDPSGIDAEASIANGAVIIYKDTNNSTVDFHQRARASLKK